MMRFTSAQGRIDNAIITERLRTLLPDGTSIRIVCGRIDGRRGERIVVQGEFGRPRQRVESDVTWERCASVESVYDLRDTWDEVAQDLANQYRDPLMELPIDPAGSKALKKLLGEFQPASRWDRLLSDRDIIGEDSGVQP